MHRGVSGDTIVLAKILVRSMIKKEITGIGGKIGKVLSIGKSRNEKQMLQIHHEHTHVQ